LINAGRRLTWRPAEILRWESPTKEGESIVDDGGTDFRERVRKLRETVLRLPSVCTERAYLLTESYKETKGKPPLIRQAMALANVLDEMTVFIGDGELIVGNVTSKVRGGEILPEINAQWMLDELDDFATREWDRFEPLTEGEKATIKEVLSWWEGQSLYDMWRARIPEDKLRFLTNGLQGGTVMAHNSHYLTHNACDYEMVLAKGLDAIKAEVDEELATLDFGDLKQYRRYPFLKASSIALGAASRFSKRYAQLAEDLAAKEGDPRRRAELERIAATCAQVPSGPARSFFEALQSMIFIWTVLTIEGNGYGLSFGRVDQYLYPFYKHDLEAGKLTADEARSLIALFNIKLNGAVTVTDKVAATVFAGYLQAVNVTLGGVTSEGRDAVNDLTYLFLEADLDSHLPQNDMVIRVNRNNPDAYVMKACEVAKTLRGKIKFVGDEVALAQLLNDGYPIDYARDYVVTGCNSPSVAGRSFDIPGGMFNTGLMLELALNDGRSRLTGEQIGPRTGDPRKFTSFEEVLGAYKKQVEALLPIVVLFKNVDRMLFGEFAPTPFQSSLFHGPIEKGLDIGNGGTAPYARVAVSLVGTQNVGDSLAAIKKTVFEDKKITMDRLITALDEDFEGEEEVLHLLSDAPKYGNDDDYVDSIVNEVLMHGRDYVVAHQGACGITFNVAASAVTSNVPLGWAVGALPDGRKARQPLADGGLSPCSGRNVCGPTATYNSVAKLDHAKLTNGSVLNMKFSPGALKDETSLRKFASMTRTFLETGGFLVQFNVVDTPTLRAAQREPEKYRDLLVRVATYSACFVELSPQLQEDIINRMEFEEL
jgi:pyruvate formate-lyase/glycerol dehydratase family glycyl radical enzyme